MNLKKVLTIKINLKSILLLSIIFLALFLRLYQLEKRTSFGADQEELSYKAIELLSGDPVLLGMPTSVGGFTIGPYFTYLWTVFFFLFSGNPVAGSYLSIFLGLITIAAVYYFAKIIFKSDKTALFLAIIYTFSNSVYIWDISPWPPSLFYLSQILLITGAYMSMRKSLGFILVALGFAIGFSSHISVFISLVPIGIFWLVKYKEIRKHIEKRYVLYSIAIVIIGILPNLAFDLTHQFVNIKRLFGLIANPQTESFYPVTTAKIFGSLYGSGEVLIPSIDKKIAPYIFWGFVITTIVTYGRSKNKDLLLLILLSLFIPALVFFFWKGNFSEYYLTMITVPAFIFLTGYLLNYYINRQMLIVGVLVLIFLFINIRAWKNRNRPLNLAAMKNTVKLITQKGGSSGYGVSLSTKPGYQFGYKYLFDYYKSFPDIPPRKGETKIFTIVIPPGMDGIQAKVEYDGIGVLWEGIN